MATEDPRVDAYIAGAQPFAQPILARLRQAVHAGCPDAAETIKWGMPFFMHGIRNLANMAAFKQHCAFGFWHGRDAADQGRDGEAMGQFGRILSLADLPSARELKGLVQAAVAHIDANPAAPRPAKAGSTPRPALATPDDFNAALEGNAAARAAYDGSAPSHRREYLQWVLEAKQPATRARRIAQAVERLAAGKQRD